MIFIRKIKLSLFRIWKSINLIPVIYEIYLENYYEKRRKNSKNPFLKSFKRYSLFSQADEDSIVDELIKRLNIKNGKFIELGVGDGAQNNTLNLLSQNWQGIWIGNEDLIFKPGKKLKYIKTWITKENIIKIINSNLDFFSHSKDFGNLSVDLLSIDLDGNDYYIWEKILSDKLFPKIIIAEYNANLGPRAIWKMTYDSLNNWKSRRDNYFGASFFSLVNLFKKFGYIPICCNSDTGVNLFAVKDEYKSSFEEILNVHNDDIFEFPHYALSIFGKTHKFSKLLLEEISD